MYFLGGFGFYVKVVSVCVSDLVSHVATLDSHLPVHETSVLCHAGTTPICLSVLVPMPDLNHFAPSAGLRGIGAALRMRQ